MRHDNGYTISRAPNQSILRQIRQAHSKQAQDKRGLPRATCPERSRRSSRGFTLLELLIVIAIIAIISAILIFVLNPAETLRKGRDSQRISDLSTINRAIALYITTSFNSDLDGNNSRGDCGTHVFVGRGNSPDITATSTAEKILSQPDGDSTTSTVDGTGWIPVNLASISGGSPIPRLPLDPSYRVVEPSNVTDNDLLYLYGCDTDLTWELNANLESNQFSSGGEDDRESTDGGNNINIHEVGTKLTILGTSGTAGEGPTSAGPNSPSVVVNQDNPDDSDDLFWGTPGNAATSNDSYAWIDGLADSESMTSYLEATGFGFSIPVVAIIDGIVVEFEKKRGNAIHTIADYRVRIVKNGIIGTTDRADAITQWPVSDTYISHGSSGDLWGEVWTPADINAAGFGAAIIADQQLGYTFSEPYVDHIRITVYYTK